MEMPIETALPGFVGLREFFRRLKSPFEPVPVDTTDIGRFRRGILSIHGTPRDDVETSTWVWFATAKAHEARRYSDGTWLVRFGVREVYGDCSMFPKERQLIMAFDGDANMKFYTLVDGTGLTDDEDNLEFKFSKYYDDKHPRQEADGWASLHKYIQTMDKDDFFIVSKKGCQSFFQAIGERHDGNLTFLVEYNLNCYVWHFTAESNVSREGLVQLVDALKDGGFPALQDAADWRQIDVERHWRHYRKTVCIDQWLKAAEMRAQAEGDTATAERCLGLLKISEDGREPLSIAVDVESATSELEQIRRLSCDADLFTAAERKRITEFLELYSAHARSERKNLEG